MIRILLRSAWETWRADGLKVLAEQTLRYMILYGSPIRLGRYWLNRWMGKTKQVVRVQGSLMELNLKDRGIHADLFISGSREPQATRYLQQILQPKWRVVDIGANIGYYALMEARQVKVVYAIEPGRANCENLIANAFLNPYRNIKCHHLAIGDHNGSVGFHLSKACNWNRIAVGNDSTDTEVSMTTLDDFVRDMVKGKRVDFVRMDVEGYEMAILRGADRVLRTNRPAMFIEVHRDLLEDYGSSQLEFMELLADYNYGIIKCFISARQGPEGPIKMLLVDDDTRYMITRRGIASHMFFATEPR